MSTIAFWSGVGLIALTILMSLPGLRELLRPFVEAAAKLIGGIMLVAGQYGLWLLQRLVRAHVEVGKHLVLPAEHFDPTVQIKKQMRDDGLK